MHDLDARYDTSVAALRPLGVIPTAQLDEWTAAVAAYRQFRDTSLLPAAERTNTAEQVQALVKRCDAMFKPVETLGKTVGDIAVAQAAQTAGAAKASADSTRRIMIMMLVFGLLVGLLLAFAATRVIVRSLSQVRRVLDAVADGDLTQVADVDSADETGLMANALVGRPRTSGRRSRRWAPAPRAWQVPARNCRRTAPRSPPPPRRPRPRSTSPATPCSRSATTCARSRPAPSR